MRVWATSDLHIDYQENFKWFLDLSAVDYTNDILIIAGDVHHDLSRVAFLFEQLVPKFHSVLFVPGNHDLWLPKETEINSLQKFHQLLELSKQLGVKVDPYVSPELAIVPLFSWYDFSFGEPSSTIKRAWRDFKRCRWDRDLDALTTYFLDLNEAHLQQNSKAIISFSHFVPSRALIPEDVPPIVESLIPVFGAERIHDQLQRLRPNLHIYGHSHLNRSVYKEGIWYLNNAFGYPQEGHICRKKLMQVYDGQRVVTGIKQWPSRREN